MLLFLHLCNACWVDNAVWSCNTCLAPGLWSGSKQREANFTRGVFILLHLTSVNIDNGIMLAVISNKNRNNEVSLHHLPNKENKEESNGKELLEEHNFI